jgi:pSer/pThr/pTyr-binding forkhead associated (FHA) protein
MSRSNGDNANGGRPGYSSPAFRVAPLYTQEGILQPLGELAGRDLIILPRTQPFRIGRDSSCELQLFDVRVSRQHARIEFSAGEYVLTDLNSSNGVYVNGTRLTQPVALQHDDTIEIGSFGGIVFRFEFVELS